MTADMNAERETNNGTGPKASCEVDASTYRSSLKAACHRYEIHFLEEICQGQAIPPWRYIYSNDMLSKTALISYGAVYASEFTYERYYR